MNNTNTKTIVITGGSKGLGLRCVEKLLAQQVRVFVLSRSKGQLEPLLKSHTNNLTWIATDISDGEAVTAAFTQIQTHTHQLDGLILNAALAYPSSLADMDNAYIQSNIMINLAGPLFCLREAAPLLKNGRVIFVSSESVKTPYPMLSLYASVKAAVETLCNSLRAELQKANNIKLTIFRVGHMADTAFGESWSPTTIEKFYAAANESGALKKSGSAMPTQNVAESILSILALPDESNIHEIDYRSANAL